MTVRKKRNTQEGILIDRINDLTQKIPQHILVLMNLMSILMLTHLTVSILFTLISLPFHIYSIDQLSTLLNTLKVECDILGITESRLRADKQAINNNDLNGYVIESTLTAELWSVLLYINKNINFKLIYKRKELESVFIEIINRKGKNTIAGCIYRHPCMEVIELMMFFSKTFLKNFFMKIKKSLLWVNLILIFRNMTPAVTLQHC